MIPTIVAIVLCGLLVAFLLLDLLIWSLRMSAYLADCAHDEKALLAAGGRREEPETVLWAAAHASTGGAPRSILSRVLPWRTASHQLRAMTLQVARLELDNVRLSRVEGRLCDQIEELEAEIGVRRASRALSGGVLE